MKLWGINDGTHTAFNMITHWVQIKCNILSIYHLKSRIHALCLIFSRLQIECRRYECNWYSGCFAMNVLHMLRLCHIRFGIAIEEWKRENCTVCVCVKPHRTKNDEQNNLFYAWTIWLHNNHLILHSQLDLCRRMIRIILCRYIINESKLNQQMTVKIN